MFPFCETCVSLVFHKHFCVSPPKVYEMAPLRLITALSLGVPPRV